MKDGKVVEDWEDLSNIPKDKLIKLRDIATDNVRELEQAAQDERMLLLNVLAELKRRTNNQ